MKTDAEYLQKFEAKQCTQGDMIEALVKALSAVALALPPGEAASRAVLMVAAAGKMYGQARAYNATMRAMKAGTTW